VETDLTATGPHFWETEMHRANPNLAGKPAVGGPDGLQPNTVNGRFTAGLGNAY
jgi:hypothetical protein